MRRGEVWTVAGGAYAGKPRPAIIVQSDRVTGFNSVTVVPCTTDPTDAPLIRPELQPSAGNGLHADCRVMVDKITTVPRGNFGTRIGMVSAEDMLRIDRSLLLFLGIG